MNGAHLLHVARVNSCALPNVCAKAGGAVRPTSVVHFVQPDTGSTATNQYARSRTPAAPNSDFSSTPLDKKKPFTHTNIHTRMPKCDVRAVETVSTRTAVAGRCCINWTCEHRQAQNEFVAIGRARTPAPHVSDCVPLGACLCFQYALVRRAIHTRTVRPLCANARSSGSKGTRNG